MLSRTRSQAPATRKAAVSSLLVHDRRLFRPQGSMTVNEQYRWRAQCERHSPAAGNGSTKPPRQGARQEGKRAAVGSTSAVRNTKSAQCSVSSRSNSPLSFTESGSAGFCTVFPALPHFSLWPAHILRPCGLRGHVPLRQKRRAPAVIHRGSVPYSNLVLRAFGHRADFPHESAAGSETFHLVKPQEAADSEVD